MRQAGFTLIELLIVVAIIAILAGIGVQAALYAFDVARASKSVTNMRQVASALMQYETATSTLPPGGLQPVSAILPALGDYAGRVNPKDGWGRDLFYEPLNVGGQLSFRVWSYGKDGTADGAVTGTWLDFNSDTVNESGVFVQSKW